jgi:O-antigen ligase
VERRADQLTRHMDRVEEIRVDARIGAPQEVRIRAYLAGGNAFLQKPLLGWGPGQVRPILAEAGADDLGLGHFHNFYLQLAVALGLVGLLGFLALYLLPLWYLRSSKGGDALPVSMRVFAVSLWVYVMVLGLATIRHDDPAGQALYVMALGVAAMGLGVRYRGRLGR